jgi:hypothetical protein
MEAMIQPVNSYTINPESQTAESLVQPAQSFQEVLFKQIVSDEKKAVNSSTVSPESQTAESPLQPAPSPEGVLPKQSVSEEKNEEKIRRWSREKLPQLFS